MNQEDLRSLPAHLREDEEPTEYVMRGEPARLSVVRTEPAAEMSPAVVAGHLATLVHLAAVIDSLPLEELEIAAATMRDGYGYTDADVAHRMRWGAVKRAAHNANRFVLELRNATMHAEDAAERAGSRG